MRTCHWRHGCRAGGTRLLRFEWTDSDVIGLYTDNVLDVISDNIMYSQEYYCIGYPWISLVYNSRPSQVRQETSVPEETSESYAVAIRSRYARHVIPPFAPTSTVFKPGGSSMFHTPSSVGVRTTLFNFTCTPSST